MTNTALNAFITTHKEALCAITLDNNRCIYIGYGGTSHAWDEIITETIGGEDFFHVTSVCKTQQPHTTYFAYYPTDTIQGIYVMAPGFEDYRIDPLILK